jgi:hypothetical protein
VLSDGIKVWPSVALADGTLIGVAPGAFVSAFVPILFEMEQGAPYGSLVRDRCDQLQSTLLRSKHEVANFAMFHHSGAVVPAPEVLVLSGTHMRTVVDGGTSTTR